MINIIATTSKKNINNHEKNNSDFMYTLGCGHVVWRVLFVFVRVRNNEKV